jgi:hypothetical protein
MSEDERPTIGHCGIYEVDRLNLIEWAANGVHHARCSICSATFTHGRRDSAVELYLAHISAPLAEPTRLDRHVAASHPRRPPGRRRRQRRR